MIWWAAVSSLWMDVSWMKIPFPAKMWAFCANFTVHDPPHVVFQPVAVPDLDRVPRGLENVRPTIMKVRCEGPGVGPPRFSAVAGVGHHRNAAQSRRQHRRVSRKDAFVALGGFHPHLRPADRLVPRPKMD